MNYGPFFRNPDAGKKKRGPKPKKLKQQVQTSGI